MTYKQLTSKNFSNSNPQTEAWGDRESFRDDNSFDLSLEGWIVEEEKGFNQSDIRYGWKWLCHVHTTCHTLLWMKQSRHEFGDGEYAKWWREKVSKWDINRLLHFASMFKVWS